MSFIPWLLSIKPQNQMALAAIVGLGLVLAYQKADKAVAVWRADREARAEVQAEIEAEIKEINDELSQTAENAADLFHRCRRLGGVWNSEHTRCLTRRFRGS